MPAAVSPSFCIGYIAYISYKVKCTSLQLRFVFVSSSKAQRCWSPMHNTHQKLEKHSTTQADRSRDSCRHGAGLSRDANQKLVVRPKCCTSKSPQSRRPSHSLYSRERCFNRWHRRRDLIIGDEVATGKLSVRSLCKRRAAVRVLCSKPLSF